MAKHIKTIHVETTHTVELTQTEVDVIHEMLRNVPSCDLKKHAPELLDMFYRIGTRTIAVKTDTSAIYLNKANKE